MTESFPLIIKWNKESLKIDFVVASGVKGLKTELEEKTGVPADRMKLMAKSKGLWKGVLKDDVDMSAIDFATALSKAGGKELQCLLMGSATKLTGPKEKVVFIEDLPPEEVARVKEPSGLLNLGNTCYLNSVVQCLRVVPELRRALDRFTPEPTSSLLAGTAAGAASGLLTTLRETFNALDRSVDAIPPSSFLRVTQTVFPQFAQRGPQGQLKQQDAEEFLSGVFTVAAESTTHKAEVIQAALPGVTTEKLNGADNLIDALFGMKMEETLTCDELESTAKADATADKMEVDGQAAEHQQALVEPPVIKYDLHRKLVCNIQGGSDHAATANVGHIAEGISLSLHGKIEKHSEVLQRNAIWSRTQRIARLPPLIVVQFGRFYWKETPDSQDHAGVKCKVMKPVAFASTLDVYDFCTEKIQKVLKAERDKQLAAEEDRINKKLKGELESKDTDKESGETKMETDQAQKNDASEEDAALQQALAMSMQTGQEEQKQDPIGPGLPENFKGIYELFGVVTHKGRDADGGHYMGWVKAQNSGKKANKISDTNEDNEDWFVFDDDEVSPCKTEDVLKLKGGGDWHMSYLNFYRVKE